MGKQRYSVREAAKRLGISEDALRMRISRSIKNPSISGALESYLDDNVKPPVRYVYLGDDDIPDAKVPLAAAPEVVEAYSAPPTDLAREIEVARLRARVELLEMRLDDKDELLRRQEEHTQRIEGFYQAQVASLQEAIAKQPAYRELMAEAQAQARQDVEALMKPVLLDLLKALKRGRKKR